MPTDMKWSVVITIQKIYNTKETLQPITSVNGPHHLSNQYFLKQ